MRPEHAVVIGGSVAGLLAASAAAKHFQRVTVLERDELAEGPVTRKGVPQGNQIHILLPIGGEVIEELLPGILHELVEEGCSEYNCTSDIPALSGFGWYPRITLAALNVVGFRRPLIEWIIRRRLLDLDNVGLRHATVTGFTIDEARSKLTGITTDDGPLATDLVIDASGRGTKTPKWLTKLGFGSPTKAEVRTYIGYATQFVRLREHQLKPGVRGIGTYPQPLQPVGGTIMPADDDVFAASAFGMMKRQPPGDHEGLVEFLAGAPSPLLSEILSGSEPVSDVHTYHFRGSLRRFWEHLESRPGRFVVTGDAACSLTPIHGQGLTMAAFGAKFLDQALRANANSLDAVPTEFQKALAAKVDVAFLLSTRGDLAYDGVELINYEPPDKSEGEYVARLLELSVRGDLQVAEALNEANFTMRPEILDTEELRRKVEAPPAANLSFDPRNYPSQIFPERESMVSR